VQRMPCKIGARRTAFEDLERQAGAIVSKSAVPISKSDAYARVFKEYPELYRAYITAQQAKQGQTVRGTPHIDCYA
jgi:hypothetical protein